MKRRRFSPAVYARIIERQNFLCACGCREKFVAGQTIHYDHITPLWLGGKDEPANLQALKPRHHGSKTTKEAKERAKIARIKARGGMLRKKPSRHDLAVAKMLNLGGE